ncbi:hypothetical protein Dda3937_04451 [Dickeya dadantii 3937]|uniref:Uncharacterized protein n=1 Tax=Dickeya dadantii (strain 3937) TaxID=198628 RepID=E0SI93_DICD3|nr:hypothetical protein Dda3937_04451 [Dickeya dadantii 3937]
MRSPAVVELLAVPFFLLLLPDMAVSRFPVICPDEFMKPVAERFKLMHSETGFSFCERKKYESITRRVFMGRCGSGASTGRRLE